MPHYITNLFKCTVNYFLKRAFSHSQMKAAEAAGGILFLALRGFFFYNNLRQRIEGIHRNIYYFFQEDLT